MSEEKPFFDLPNEDPSQKIVAAILTNAVINRLERKSNSIEGALEKVAEVYNAILDYRNSSLDTWKKLGE